MKRLLLLLAVVMLATFVISCSGGSGGGGIVVGDGEGGGDISNCADGLDSDDDGLIDCADPECSDAANCQPGAEDCDNGRDDDGDDLVDCDDPVCDAFILCQPGAEDCDNNLDDDGDGLIDCLDVEACPNTDPNCDGGQNENCNTAEDDDLDGEANCDDDDCNDFPSCHPQPDEICDNGIDDDFDNGIDCADTDCAGQPACPQPLENCCNGIDDDGDGLIDFQEPSNVCDPTNTDAALPSGGDTFPDICDNCPEKKNSTQQDNDQDGVGNSCDNCSGDYNPDQLDADDDGFGAACDCDDTNPDINPNTVWYLDADGDGYGDDATAVTQCESPGADHVIVGGDCDDSDVTANPGATEICDGVDNDCDGSIDEEGVPVTWYRDNDGDGFGDDSDTLTQCAQPPGYVVVGGDCNDGNDTINPAADEVCDGADNDCDDATDEPGAVDGTAYFVDDDGDGYGAGPSQLYCSDPGAGFATNDDDCDDTDPDVNPDSVWYADADGDGFGDDSTAMTQCAKPTPTSVLVGGDCNDGNAAVHPGATEVCNDGDNDCDGQVNEGCTLETTGPGKCDDGDDDDGDGFIDGADFDCLGQSCQAQGGDAWTDCSGTGLPYECQDPPTC